MNPLSLFILFAGYVIGLGAVTVIDLHGFFARRSSYWTEATTRTHKVTKPLIWLGTILVILGGIQFYDSFSVPAGAHLVLAVVLVVNGCFLSFRVSPYLLQREKRDQASVILPKEWQRKITMSFILSVLGWWGSFGLFIWQIAQRMST